MSCWAQSAMDKDAQKTFNKALREHYEDFYKDNVNNPHHYNHKGVECIAAIEASMEPTQFKGYLKGNILKYLWRYEYKNGLEDLKKAQWYLNKLITTWENENATDNKTA